MKKRKKKTRRIGINTSRCAVFLFTALFASPGHAQRDASVTSQTAGAPATRSIEGTIFNRQGAVAPHAVVLLKDTKTLQIRSFIAQDDGNYHFYGLSPDINYQLRAELNDMTSPTKMVSVFDSHQKIKLNLKLTKEKKK